MDTERQTNLDEVISQFNRICRVLSQCLEHNATIQQHILDETRELISQVCVDSSFASILIKESKQYELYPALERQWRQDNISTTDQRSFSHGQLYEVFQFLQEMSRVETTIVEKLCDSLMVDSSEYRVLKLIADNPSISNAGIVSRVNLSKGRVSQLVTQLKQRGRIIDVHVGNRSGYAITVSGIRILEHLRRSGRSISGIEGSDEMRAAISARRRPSSRRVEKSNMDEDYSIYLLGVQKYEDTKPWDIIDSIENVSLINESDKFDEPTRREISYVYN